MKATVSVCRIGYGHADIQVEIPDSELTGKTLGEIWEMFEAKAEDKAGNHLFNEHASDYESQGVMLPDPLPPTIQPIPDRPSNKIKLRLSLEVEYDANGTSKETLKQNLEAIANHAYADGWITGGTESEVVNHKIEVNEV